MEETHKEATRGRKGKERYGRLHRNQKETFRKNINDMMAARDRSRDNDNGGTNGNSGRVGQSVEGEVVGNLLSGYDERGEASANPNGVLTNN